MNNAEFETLLRKAESADSVEVSTHVAASLAEHGSSLTERQRVDLVYFEYLSRLSRGESDVTSDLCARYPELAQKLIRQAEVDTEFSRLDSTTADWLAPTPAADAPIDRIGEYTVVEKIGEGAQAEVFRVIHPMLRCELAMKLSKRVVEATNRILDEGRLLVTINAPGVARVIDAGLWEDRPFIVSELIRGTTLKQRVDDGTLTRRQFVELLMRLARTVEILHAAGIVHCDIKSTNVLVDTSGLPKLVDFGLAIDRRTDAWDENAVWREDHAGGTLVYMAPELFNAELNGTGSRQPISDLFSLGGLLYFGLVGCHPYEYSSENDVVANVAAGAWNREALYDSRSPSWLVRLCEASMATIPMDRIQSADQFAGELHRWLQQQSSRPVRAKAFAVFAILAITLLGWMIWRPNGSSKNTVSPQASSQAAVMPEQERLGPLDVKVWSEDRAFELVDRVPVESGDGLQINAPLRAGRSGELWLVSSEGKAERLASFPAENISRWVHYPAELDHAVPLMGPAGTEAVVWLEATEPTSIERTAKALRPMRPWPSMGDSVVFRLVDGTLLVEQEDRSLGHPQRIEAPAATVQQHLREATTELARQGIDAEIMAFSHAE
jgi:eukaryotic-like serine/threonine-protein kinase